MSARGRCIKQSNPVITFLISCAFCSILAITVEAQTGLTLVHPNLARGTGSDKFIESYSWDQVNLFNGNLNISIPLGIRYPLAGEFDYQFSIVYNSNAWDLDQSVSTVTAIPVKNSNAGFGWNLSFGRLIPPVANGTQLGRWIYVTPDGALHPFYSTLHQDVSEVDPNDSTLYTRDGSYYRLKFISADQAFVESQDGSQSLFKLVGGEWKLSQIGDRFNNRLWFTYGTNLWTLSDNHGRIHRVYFKADPSGYYPALIDKIEMAAFNGTISTTTFSYTPGSLPRPSIDNDPATSTSVNLPLMTAVNHPDGSRHAFTYHPSGAADSAGRLAGMQLPTMGKVEWTYRLYKYSTDGIPTLLNMVLRQNIGVATRRLVNVNGNVDGTWTFTPSLQPIGSEDCGMSNTVVTPLGDKTVHYFSVNTKSSGPEWNKSDYGLPFVKNQFDRPRNSSVNVALSSSGATATASNTANSLYPASAAINGDRKGLNWGNGGVWVDGSPNFFPDWLEVNFNAQRTIDKVNVFTAQDNPDNPLEPTSDMTFTQNGIRNFDVQYWNGSVWATIPGGSVIGNEKVWRQFVFLPIATNKIRVLVNQANMSSRIAEIEAFESSLAPDTRFLSSQVFDCDVSGNNCQLMRSIYTRYEQDSATDPASTEMANVNRRETSNRIVYHDDVDNGIARYADTDRSNFDGLGHFRQITTNGNFGSGDLRTVFQNYDAATGTYPSSTYVMPSPANSWILYTTSLQRITEGNSAQIIEFCYDRITGFLQRVRRRSTTHATGSASSNDVVTTYTPDASGQLIGEQYYGGDTQAIGTSSLCSLTLPATDQYRIQHTYQSGNRSNSQFYTASGTPFGPNSLDQTIDRNTGLVSISRDTAGISTRYEFDAMGRLIWIKPEAGHGAWKQHVYTLASATDYAKKFTYDKTEGGASMLNYNADVYDSFGRVWWQQTSVPGNNPERFRFYNAMGWVTSQSEFSREAPKYTEFLNYDPFGRPKTIRPADGAHHDVTLEYLGVRTVRRTSQTSVWYDPTSGQVIEVPKSTIDIYDRQGRLWQHVIPLRGWNSKPDKVTINIYNVAGRLIETKLNGEVTGSRLSYDGRGFLHLVQNAHSSEAVYQNFDAMGNALKRRFNTTDLTYVYDRAARLTRVQNATDSTKVWKEFLYAESNGVNDWRAGKLWSTKRYNYIQPNFSPVVVTETNTYGGKNGQLSRYEVELLDGLHAPEKFAQTYVYDELGMVKEIGYPVGIAAGSGDMARTRIIRSSYDVGYLTSVTGLLNGQAESWANSISYHPNGLISQLGHANGVTDIITKDPDAFVRVASVHTTGVKKLSGQADQNFYSGDFEYDGTGALVKVGTQFFLQSSLSTPNTQMAPPYSTPCQNAWLDPFKFSYAAVANLECQPQVYYYYTADDRLVKIEDRRSDTKTWYFTDFAGRNITEYKSSNSQGNWLSTRDYIYGGRSIIGIWEANNSAPAIKKFHLTRGYGSSGIITDANGYRTQIVPQ